MDVPVELQEEIQKDEKSNSKSKYEKTEMELTNENSDEKSLKPIIESAKVEEFKIKDKPYIQLSDHYGMSIDISLR